MADRKNVAIQRVDMVVTIISEFVRATLFPRLRRKPEHDARVFPPPPARGHRVPGPPRPAHSQARAGRFIFLVLLQISWRKGFEDSRGQGFKGLFSIDFVNSFSIHSLFFNLSATPLYSSIGSRYFNGISRYPNNLAFHLNP